MRRMDLHVCRKWRKAADSSGRSLGVKAAATAAVAFAEMFENGTSYIRNLLGPKLTAFADERIASFKREPDQARRMADLNELETKLKAERALLFLYHAGQSIVYHPSLQGVRMNVRSWVDYKELWVKG